MMMDGFYGRLLKIDLTHKKYQIVPIKDEIFLKYLGGKGLASYFLYKLNPEGVDPLSPANSLIFATRPVTSSMIWGSYRYGVFTKSPQTGFYADSYAGGKVPEAIDSTGFDAIVITGKHDRPSVLEIHPKGAVFHDASDIWGLNTFETEDTVFAVGITLRTQSKITRTGSRKYKHHDKRVTIPMTSHLHTIPSEGIYRREGFLKFNQQHIILFVPLIRAVCEVFQNFALHSPEPYYLILYSCPVLH